MEWKLIPLLDGAYEASEGGQIRRARGGKGTQAGRLLSTRQLPTGYWTCAPWVNNRARRSLVHRLVADAFIGPCPDGYEVNHKNLDKSDNRAVNLEYVTRSENLLHRSQSGITRGVNNHSAVLTEADVLAIRRRHSNGEGYKRLAAAYGVTWEAIRNIIKRRTWAWLEESDSPNR